jgi:hypothetical protein
MTTAFDLPVPDHVAHGYTIHDLNRAARAACVSNRTATLDFTLRHNTAWSAIAEHLITADQQPTFHDLVCAGSQAIYEDDRAAQRMYGVTTDRSSGQVVLRPRFTAYWGADNAADPPDEEIADGMAVYQILRTLPENQQQAVVALAVLDDYQKAADSLGLTYVAFKARIGRARKAFRVLWFAPDAAPRQRGTDRRVSSREGISDHCPQGHEFTPENTGRQRRGRICRACKRDRDAARRASSRALNPASAAAR